MTRNQVTSAAAAIMSSTAAVASFFVAPALESAGLSIQLAVAVIATAGFYAVFSIASRVLSVWRARRVLGRWFYVTKAYETSSFKDGNFAIMNFILNDDNDVEYQVELYKSFEDLNSKGRVQSRGAAISKACNYDAKTGAVDIVFSVRYTSDDASSGVRDGRLNLRFVKGGHMEGDWTSEVVKHLDGGRRSRELSSGTMFAARPKKFVEMFSDA